MKQFNFSDLNNLKLDNIGEWPKPVKLTLSGVVFLVLFLLGYFFHTKDQIRELDAARAREPDMKTQFEIAYARLQILNQDKEIVTQLKARIAEVQKGIPQQVPLTNLLDNITKMGAGHGIEFKSLKPLPEKDLDDYIAIPVQIIADGNYHNLASFISSLAQLNQLIAFGDFSIGLAAKKQTTTAKPTEDIERGNKLELNLSTQIYELNENKSTNVNDKAKATDKNAKKKK